MTRATVITDASHCNMIHRAAWAAWVRVDGVPDPIKHAGMFKEPVVKSWEAEMLAAINGLWLAHRAGATDVLVQTDCMSVVDMLNRKTSRSHLKRKFREALKLAGVAHVKRSARHVRGHTTVEDARSHINRWCDEQARELLRLHRAAMEDDNAK